MKVIHQLDITTDRIDWVHIGYVLPDGQVMTIKAFDKLCRESEDRTGHPDIHLENLTNPLYEHKDKMPGGKDACENLDAHRAYVLSGKAKFYS
jgi:hypothetical protein